MACIRKRRGQLVVDWRDPSGRRRWKCFPDSQKGRQAADIHLGAVQGISQRGVVLPSTRVTFGQYVERWRVDPDTQALALGTRADYDASLRTHLLPWLKNKTLVSIRKPLLRELRGELALRLKPGTVRKVFSTLAAVLDCAMRDGFTEENPARGLGRRRKGYAAQRSTEIAAKEFTADELTKFLAHARTLDSADYLRLLFLARTGVRFGEAQGIQVSDLDLDRRKCRVERQVLPTGEICPLKTDLSRRRITLSSDLVEEIRSALEFRRMAFVTSEWLLWPEQGDAYRVGQVAKNSGAIRARMRLLVKRICKATGIPTKSPHSFRHTSITLVLEAGATPLFVQRQHGHSSIKTTIDVYASRVQPDDDGALDRIAARTSVPADVIPLRK